MKVKATIKSIKTDEDGETQLQLLIPYQYLQECAELAQMIKKVLDVDIKNEM